MFGVRLTYDFGRDPLWTGETGDCSKDRVIHDVFLYHVVTMCNGYFCESIKCPKYDKEVIDFSRITTLYVFVFLVFVIFFEHKFLFFSVQFSQER